MTQYVDYDAFLHLRHYLMCLPKSTSTVPHSASIAVVLSGVLESKATNAGSANIQLTPNAKIKSQNFVADPSPNKRSPMLKQKITLLLIPTITSMGPYPHPP